MSSTIDTEKLEGRWATAAEREPQLARDISRGGFDGIHLTFAGECDIDALQAVFGRIVDAGYTLTLTLDGGATLDVEPIRWAIADDSTPALIYRDFAQLAHTRAVAFSSIVGVHIH